MKALFAALVILGFTQAWAQDLQCRGQFTEGRGAVTITFNRLPGAPDTRIFINPAYPYKMTIIENGRTVSVIENDLKLVFNPYNVLVRQNQGLVFGSIELGRPQQSNLSLQTLPDGNALNCTRI